MDSISRIKTYETCRRSNCQEGGPQSDRKKLPSPTLQGVLLSKSREENCFVPNSSLIITTPKNVHSNLKTDNEQVKSFDIKKALVPLLIGTASLFGLTAGLSMLLKFSAKKLAHAKPIEQLPDLALNMNIKQETQFAAYMMLRSPNIKTIRAALGVFAMSGITLISKNFVDGVKEIWIKKQESDIQRDLQENLIETETKVFSGKLQVERNILAETAQYFDKVFNKPDEEKQKVRKASNAFTSIQNFCGKSSNTISEKPKKNFIYGALIATTTALGIILGKQTFKNIKQTSEIANKFTNDFQEKAIDFIKDAAEKNKSEELDTVKKLFETICAKPEFIKDTLKKMNVAEDEIQKVIADVENSKKQIFADAPTALGGIPKKIQYYCYLDEDRGHLYNAIMHPENKFMKYVFLAFTSISATGYVAKQCVDALKSVAVSRENSKTELSLQNRLIDVELRNFESKKNSAIDPLVDEFNKKLRNKESNENLKVMADNILMEIKNGAPFVYS